MPRRLLSAAAAGALLLSLASCGDGEEGTVTTPPPSINIESPSDGGGDSEPSDGGGETEEPTAAAPDIPPPDPADYAGKDEQTPEGAEQAFRFYIATLAWARQSGDSDSLNTSFSDECTLCKEMSSAVNEHDARGEHWKDIDIVDTGTANFESENYDVEVGYVFIVSQHTEPNSSAPIPAQEWTGVAGMAWASESWLIEELALEETGDET